MDPDASPPERRWVQLLEGFFLARYVSVRDARGIPPMAGPVGLQGRDLPKSLLHGPEPEASSWPDMSAHAASRKATPLSPAVCTKGSSNKSNALETLASSRVTRAMLWTA